jgi:predicted PurR-regulated permease PerM
MPELLSSKMPRQISTVPVSTLTMVLVAIVAVAALYFGREVLVPIALALLLSFVLAPLVSFLQRWYFPRVVAVLAWRCPVSADNFGAPFLTATEHRKPSP